MFQQRCGKLLHSWRAQRQAQRYSRGLVLRFRELKPFVVNNWGIGHQLLALYQLHELCLRTRRYCYISLYDVGLERYFGYAAGDGIRDNIGERRPRPGTRRRPTSSRAIPRGSPSPSTAQSTSAAGSSSA